MALVLLSSCGGDDPPSTSLRCGLTCTDCTPEPIPLSSAVGSVARVLVDDAHLYIETKREDDKGHYYGVYRLPLEGGELTPLWTTFAEHTDVIETPPPGFELSHGMIYLMGDHAQRLPVNGDPALPLGQFRSLRPVFLDDGMIVTSITAEHHGSIARAALDGTEQTTLYDLGDDLAVTIARGGDDLFWVQSEQATSAFALYRGHLDGRAAVRIAGPVSPGQVFPDDIAADASHVYFFDEKSHLVRASHDGLDVESMSASRADVRSVDDACTIAVDMGSLTGGGTFMLPEPGGGRVKVADQGEYATADQHYIYVIHKGVLGRVRRQL